MADIADFCVAAQLYADAVWELLVQAWDNFFSGIDALIDSVLDALATVGELVLCILQYVPLPIALASAKSETVAAPAGCCGETSRRISRPSIYEDEDFDYQPIIDAVNWLTAVTNTATEVLALIKKYFIVPVVAQIAELIGIGSWIVGFLIVC